MKQLLPVAALLLLVWSCSVNIKEAGPVLNDTERLVTLALAMPSTPESRALASLTTTQEDKVHEVDVLLFKGEDFFYRAIGTMETDVKFTVKLPSHSSAYKLVVLANARALLSSIPPAQEQTGISRTALMSSITHPLTTPVDTWTSNLAAKGIPMWGYNSLTIDANSNAPITVDVNLTRMLAKVDITMLGTVTNFKLHSAHLYNYTTRGSISPAVSTTSSTGYDETQWHVIPLSNPVKYKAYVPNLPSSAQSTPHSYLSYALDETNSYSVTSSIGQIYAYEATQGSSDVRTNTCLVIGGYYNGSTTPTYYRVEFGNTDENFATVFYHILRNHHYNVSIKQVQAAGYSTQNDAYINRPANITVVITDWNNGGEGETVFTPQYSLFVDKSDIYFYLDKGQKSMTINTDYPDGWSITDKPGWLKIVGDSTGPANTPTTLTLKPKDDVSPVDGSYFHIVAGNLKKRIYLWALDENELSLEVNPTTLTFYKTPVPKTVALTPYGGRTDIPNPFELGTAGPLTWTSTYDPTLNLSNILLSNTLTLYPGVNNTGNNIGGVVTVMLNGEQGKTVSRSINITQLANDMVFTPTGTLNYAATAGNHTFNVNSPDATWKLTDATNATYLTLTDEDGDYHPATTSAFTYHFSLTANNNSFIPRDVTLEATSDNPEFYPTPAAKPTIKIVQAAGATPAISITNSSDFPYTFGGSKVVNFTTNAPWQITTDATYASVIGDIKKDATARTPDNTYTTPNATPGSPATDYVTVSAPTVNTGMAGITESVLTFRTVTGATEATATAAFKHTVPAVFSVVASPAPAAGNLTTSATNITLTATDVNIPWWGEVSGLTSTTKQSSNVVTPQTTDQVTVTIPAQAWNVASSWTSTVTVQAGYDAYNGILALNPLTTFVYNRPAYTLSVDQPANIGYGGATFTVDVTTNAPGYTLDFMAGAVKLTNVTGTGPVTAVASPSITIPANNTNAARTINIVNHYDPTNPTPVLASFTQAKPPKYFLRAVSNGFQNGYFQSCPTGYKGEYFPIADSDDVVELLDNSPNYTFAPVPNGTYYRVTPRDPYNLDPVNGWVGYPQELVITNGVIVTDTQYLSYGINYGNDWEDPYFSSWTINYIVCVLN